MSWIIHTIGLVPTYVLLEYKCTDDFTMNKIVLCYHIKQTLRRCHVIIGLFNNWSKEVSKYGMDISDTFAAPCLPLFCSYHILCHLWCLLNSRMATWNLFVSPLTTKSDWHLISPYQITPWLKHEGHENKGNDQQLKILLIVKQILLFNTLRNVQRKYGEYAYWCWGVKG